MAKVTIKQTPGSSAAQTPDQVFTMREGTQLTVVLPRKDASLPGRARVPAAVENMVGGLANAVASIREVVRAALFHPESFTRFGLEPPKGVLLHGPPGTGKTLIARSLAQECEVELFVINGPEVWTRQSTPKP